MLLFYTIISFLLCICGFFVSFSKNSIISVFFLILSFFNASLLLFVLNTDFLALMFIIIYVGAIAVLFLFIIMMLNIKIIGISYKDKKNLTLVIFFVFPFIIFIIFLLDSFFFFSQHYSFFKESFFSIDIISGLKFDFLNYDSFNNIDVFGQTLYNYFLICFLIVGIILLIGLLGAIILTSRFKNKNQKFAYQLSRKDNFLSFF
jgi:NADH-quinone oxidoreductase subunit J